MKWVEGICTKWLLRNETFAIFNYTENEGYKILRSEIRWNKRNEKGQNDIVIPYGEPYLL